MRKAAVQRKTNETDIVLSLDLDGRGESQIDTGVGFLDHMLTLLARHGRMDLEVKCQGDTWVDDHHTVEDIGIAWERPFLRPWETSGASPATPPSTCPWMRPSSCAL